MGKTKIVIIFIVILSISSYFIFKGKNFDTSTINIGNFNLFDLGFTKKEPKYSVSDEGNITINEKDLGELIKVENKILKDPSLDITESDIRYTGKITVPMETEISAGFEPKMEDEKLVILVRDLKVGGLEAPGYIKKQLEGLLSKSINREINNHFKVKDVIIREESLVILIN